jgi:hypothetical protein
VSPLGSVFCCRGIEKLVAAQAELTLSAARTRNSRALRGKKIKKRLKASSL